MHRIGTYKYYFNVADVISSISKGEIQVPEFMSNEFYWGEEKILNLLDCFYFGIYRTNILVIDSGTRFERLQNGPFKYVPDLIIPSRRLSREISKTSIKFPDGKPGPKYGGIYYIIDGFHRLQSLYLAWYGLFNGKQLYFKISAINETRFSFLKPANRDSMHARLSTVKNISIPDMPLLDQVNDNCHQFKQMFFESDRISFDIIDIDDPLLDQVFLATLDKNPDMKIVADRIRFIRENYIIPKA